ncbi:hypothetical protein D3C87_1275160 [compost metagenome]
MVKNQPRRILHRLERHQQRLALFWIAAVAFPIVVVQQVRRRGHHAVGPAQLADVVERRSHGQVATGAFVQVMPLAVDPHQLDDLAVGLFGRRQPQVGQQREHLGAGDVAVLEFFVGQVEHVGGLLQLGGTGGDVFLEGGIEQLQLLVLIPRLLHQTQAFTLGVLVGQGLSQRQQHLLIVPGFADVTMNLPFIDGFDNDRRIGVTGQHDPGGVGVSLMDMGQQRGAVHIGHARIAHHQVDGLLRHDLQGLGTAGGQQHVIGLAAQKTTQAVEDRRLIIDQQHFGFIGQCRGELLFHGVTSSETAVSQSGSEQTFPIVGARASG